MILAYVQGPSVTSEGYLVRKSSLARRLIYELKYRKGTKPVVSFGIFFYTSHIYLHQIYVPNLSVGVMSLTLAKMDT